MLVLALAMSSFSMMLSFYVLLRPRFQTMADDRVVFNIATPSHEIFSRQGT